MQSMSLSTGDFSVILLYFAVSIGLGLFLSRRGGKSLSEYFLSGRSVPWWLVGTGMVATTFAADTPLFITGVIGTSGISGNWVWWSAAAGGMLTVFFFARLWRRAGVLTDLEFIEIRYTGRAASILRGFKSIYFGLFINCIVMGWVNLAMLGIMRILFPEVDGQLAVTICALVTLAYVAISGLWGVMIADAFQFTVALGGCILLAVFAVQHPRIQAAGGLNAALPAPVYDFLPHFSDTNFWPEQAVPASDVSNAEEEPNIINEANATNEANAADETNTNDGNGLQRIDLWSFLAFILIQWWASWYPGAEPGGGGYIAQRIMSARNERHGLLATLWFVVAHYCVRSWPWIVGAIVAVALYPELNGAEREAAYIRLIGDVLPSPLRGLLIAAFLGAYMSTISTHLNWGSSYLINDFYRRFAVKDRNESHYISVSRVTTIGLMLVSLLVSFYVFESIKDAWLFLLSCTAGMGAILILRWYWWRVNAWSEIASMLIPVAVVTGLEVAYKLGIPRIPEPKNLFIIVPITLLLTLLVLFLTPAEPDKHLAQFFERVRPAGPGWKHIARRFQLKAQGSLWRPFLGWILGTVLVYAGLFLPGAIILGRFLPAMVAAVCLSVAVVGLIFVIRAEFSGDVTAEDSR
ncbi:MAG: Na+:solute symporter [Leptospiraceae bacterium]|nr:Na+:solute symporter [Leptospiraceae bacterium]